MIKLLVLQSELGVLRGGGENFTRNLFATLAKRGYQISAAFVAAPSGAYEVPMPPGITPIPLGGWWTRKPGQPALSFLARYVRSGSRLAARLEQVKESLDWRGARWHDQRFHRRVRREFASRWNEFDAVYVHGNLELACEAALHRPTILRLPGPMSASSGPLLRKVPVVCANGDALERLRVFMGDDVTELPVGVNFESFAPGPSSVRSGLGWTEEHKVMGYVGRLTRLKGVDLLAEAFLQVARTLPEARLIMIGGGEEEQRMRHVLAKEIAGGTAHMVPGLNTADLAAWYRAMDVFILPSRYENFSNSLLEAAACGIPFIASDIGGNRIIQKSGSGALFAPSSATDLARRMHEFFAESELWRTHALAFSPVVRERYSWEASADRLEWILESRLSLKTLRVASVQPRQRPLRSETSQLSPAP